VNWVSHGSKRAKERHRDPSKEQYAHSHSDEDNADNNGKCCEQLLHKSAVGAQMVLTADSELTTRAAAIWVPRSMRLHSDEKKRYRTIS
jgi:hypothetical protein